MTAPSSPATPEAWLGALSRVMACVSANAECERVISALADGLVQEFGAAFARIWLYDATDHALHARATVGIAPDPRAPMGLINLAGPTSRLAHALIRHEPVIVDEIGPESGFQDLGWIDDNGLRAFAGLPLWIDDRLIGAMTLYRRSPFPPSMLDALGVLARQASLALEHARLIEESHTLQSIAARVASARDTSTLLSELVQRAMAAFGADGCAVWLRGANGTLNLGASNGLSERFHQRLVETPKPNARMFLEVRRTRKPIYTRDDQAEARRRSASLAATVRDEGIVSALRLPLVEPGGDVGGIMCLYHRRERAYGDNEIRLAQAFTDQISVALHNARLADQQRVAQRIADRELARAATLATITERLLAAPDLAGVLHVVVEASVRLCSAGGAVVALVDSSRRNLTPTATHGRMDAWFATFEETTLDDAYASDGPTGEAIARGGAVLVPDYAARPISRPAQAATVAAGVHSFIAAPLRTENALLGMLWVADDRLDSLTSDDAATVQTLADQAALAIEQARLIEESHTLQTIAAELASAADTRTLLKGIVRRSMAALGADACGVWLLDEATNTLTVGAVDGFPRAFLTRAAELVSAGASFHHIAFGALQQTAEPMYHRDARPTSGEPRDALAQLIDNEGIISVLRMPLLSPDGQVLGMLGMYHRRERLYSPREVRLAQAFTDQIAVALRNARLREAERQARELASRELERRTAIAQITERLLGATDPDAMLSVVAESAARLCAVDGALVGLIETASGTVHVAAACGAFMPPADRPVGRDRSMPNPHARRRTVLLADLETTLVVPDAAQPQTLVVRIPRGVPSLRSYIASPLRIGGSTIGVLMVGDRGPRAFAPHDVELVEALADQATLAIDHGRLMRRGTDAAVLEERARLARDLHDSVTQSIFSLGMMSRAAETQHARGADSLGRTLGRISQLAQDALREMRALLFELQPSTLAEEGLVGALARLAAGFRARLEIPVEFIGESALRLDAAVETAIFRIVQEALGNAGKHARASALTITFTETERHAIVTVADNGRGFDPADAVAVSADGARGGMGMQSMRDRAETAGLTLRITSAFGRGTTVRIDAPKAGP